MATGTSGTRDFRKRISINLTGIASLKNRVFLVHVSLLYAGWIELCQCFATMDACCNSDQGLRSMAVYHIFFKVLGLLDQSAANVSS
jgi:hypothetical protein